MVEQVCLGEIPLLVREKHNSGIGKRMAHDHRGELCRLDLHLQKRVCYQFYLLQIRIT